MTRLFAHLFSIFLPTNLSHDIIVWSITLTLTMYKPISAHFRFKSITRACIYIYIIFTSPSSPRFINGSSMNCHPSLALLYAFIVLGAMAHGQIYGCNSLENINYPGGDIHTSTNYFGVGYGTKELMFDVLDLSECQRMCQAYHRCHGDFRILIR